MKLNEKISYYRKAAKLSQEELAARVRVSRQAVSTWELGDATPEVDKLLALARAFGVTTDELLGEGEPAESAKKAEQPQEEPPVYTVPDAPAGNNFDKATGLIGRLIRRYGWLLGVRVALGGLGFTIVGALARWGFGAMFAASDSMFGGMGMEFTPGTPLEVQQAILEEMGIAPAVSPLGGIQGFFLGFANVILVLGVVTMLAGAALAVVLYQKGNKKP